MGAGAALAPTPQPKEARSVGRRVEKKEATGETRINLTLSAQAAERLEAIKVTMDTSSTADAVRMALRIADFVTEQASEGNDICIKKPDGSITELKLFI